MAKPRDFTLTFTGAGLQEVMARGRFLRVLEADSYVYFALDGSSEYKRVAGQQIADSDPDGFHRVRVRSEIAQTVRFTVAETSQDDGAASVNVSATATVEPGNDIDNGGDVTVTAGASDLVLPADLSRLAAIITNPQTNAATVRVGGATVGASSGIPLAPGESITLATTAAIYVFNTGATDQTVSALGVRSI